MTLGAWALGSVLLLASPARDERVVPPAPTHHFTDHASHVAQDVAQRLDARLARYERETTNQFLVVIFAKLPFSPLEEFTRAAANAWGVGQEGQDNGVALFVFVQDRRLRLEVGRGLETTLTDALAKRILDEVITPRFRAADMAGGLEKGVEAVITVLSGRPLPTPPSPAAPTGVLPSPTH